MLTQSKCENRANYVWWGCVCVSASNFFGDWAVHTRFFFFFEYRSPWCYNFFSVFLETQRGIFMNKVTFPKADKPGLMIAEWNSFGCSSGGRYVPRKGCQWPEEMWFGFAGAPVCCGLFPTPTPMPMFCSTLHNCRGLGQNPPVTRRVSQHYLGGLKGNLESKFQSME